VELLHGGVRGAELEKREQSQTPLRMAIEASSTCGEISPRAYNTKTKFLILGDTKEEENLWITVRVSLRRYFVIHQLRLISLRENLK
jgi:hypothetical protein